MDGADGVKKGTQLWVKAKGVYQLGEVTKRTRTMVDIRVLDSGKSFSIDLENQDMKIHKANPKAEADMTSLRHLHLPGILYNLKERAMLDAPYTFLGGNVLVAVNPLRRIPDPDVLGKKKAMLCPHPYAMAESAYQQMCFAASRKEKDAPIDQSILVSGESGAGKTESSKMVLNHLVARCVDSSTVADLDERLLRSNPILEAFGNAATKRNHNSSRFGKFMKLHFEAKKGRKFIICGASVETYLLERSRITSHSEGERGYHVFYHLISGGSKKMKAELKLDRPFKYLIPKKREVPSDGRKNGTNRSKSLRLSLQRLESTDKSYFKGLCEAFDKVGIPSSDSTVVDQKLIFGVLASLLHLGNVEFVNDNSTSEGNVAKLADTDSLELPASLLGVKAKSLFNLFVERKRMAMGEEIISRRDAQNAKDAVDAVVKSLYVRLFEWIIRMISKNLGKTSKGNHFIGVLDIFGFECFSINEFEQLLINYANEALQSSFYKQIFEAEAELYKSEGILAEQDSKLALPLDNVKCMELLRGTSSKKVQVQLGILGIIDAEGKTLNALDEKMNTALHQAFKDHPNFPTPHPKERRNHFIVKHFAGEVKYRVDFFLEKNSDKVPHEVNELFQSSTNILVGSLFEPEEGTKDKMAVARRTVKGLNDSIISKFKRQIDKLLSTLDKTRCWFIRCVKPNPHMIRDGSDSSWLDEEYIIHQLENLCIPETTQVLKGGFPTRLSLKSVMDSFLGALPKESIRGWKGLQSRDPSSFTKAFVYSFFLAYEVDPTTYKVGLTRVFFKTGELEKINNLLEDTDSGKTLDEGRVRRYRKLFASYFWRRAFVKVLAVNRFQYLLDMTRERNGAATILQRIARRRLIELKFKSALARLREEKRKKEEQERRENARLARKRQKELKRIAEEAARQKAKDAEALRLENARLEEEALQKEALAAQAEKEKQDARAYRLDAEKAEKKARKEERRETELAIKRCGGEEGYLSQKKREMGIRFDDDIRVEEYAPYLSDEHMEPPSSSSNTRETEEEIRKAQTPDLQAIAKDVTLVSAATKIAREKLADVTASIRRSYVRPVSLPPKTGTTQESSLGANLYSEHVWVAKDNDMPLTSKSNLTKEGSKKKKGLAAQRASSRLACFLGVGGNRARHSAPVGGGFLAGKRQNSDMLVWKQCFVSLKGFQLQYFAESVLDEEIQELVGVKLLGSIDMAGVKEILRFDKVDAHPGLAASNKLEPINPDCVLKLSHVSGRSPILRFDSVQDCNRWSKALDNALALWKEEVRAMRRFNKGRLKSGAMTEYKQLYDEGVISKNDFKAALGQQVSDDYEYVTQQVAIYGEESYDRRIICSECRAVNHLVGEFNGSIHCHDCGTEISEDGSVLTSPTPQLDTPEPDSMATSTASTGSLSFPFTIPLQENGSLTVHQGELMGRPRYDARSGQRQYYYSFRCVFEPRKEKKNARYWSVDYPFPAFKLVHDMIEKELKRRGVSLSLPRFPLGDYDVDNPKELAKMRLRDLNIYMAQLMDIAEHDESIFRARAMQYFFNLKANVEIAPFSLSQFKELQKAFHILQEFMADSKPMSENLYALYSNLQATYQRLEASADEDVVFNTTDGVVADHSLQQKGEIVRIAKECLDILDRFEVKFMPQITKLQKAEAAGVKLAK